MEVKWERNTKTSNDVKNKIDKLTETQAIKDKLIKKAFEDDELNKSVELSTLNGRKVSDIIISSNQVVIYLDDTFMYKLRYYGPEKENVRIDRRLGSPKDIAGKEILDIASQQEEDMYIVAIYTEDSFMIIEWNINQNGVIIMEEMKKFTKEEKIEA